MGARAVQDQMQVKLRWGGALDGSEGTPEVEALIDGFPSTLRTNGRLVRILTDLTRQSHCSRPTTIKSLSSLNGSTRP